MAELDEKESVIRLMRLSKSSGLASGEESGYSTSPATPGLTVGSKFNALVETVEEEENEEEEEEEEVVVEEVAVPSGLQSSNIIKAYEVSLIKYKQNVQRLQAELDSTKHDKEELMKEFDSYKQETQETVSHLTLSIHEKEQVIAELEKKLQANQEEFKNLQQKMDKSSSQKVSSASDLQEQRRKPTKVELLGVERNKLRIISEIASYGNIACEDLATLLLHDDLTVRKLHREAKDNEEIFIRRVFDNWLSQDDDCAVPCTWENLCSCIENTSDLPGSLVKEIRHKFCS